MKRSAMILASVLALGVHGVSAQGQKTNDINLSSQKGTEGSAAAVSLLNQAARLVRYARENQSAVAMLAAVQMIENVRLQDGTERVGVKKTGIQQQGERVESARQWDIPMPTLDPRKLLAEIDPWLARYPQLRALVEAEGAKAKPAASRSLVVPGGPVRHEDQVLAHHYDDYVFGFVGGEVASVAIVGGGNTGLDLYIYDENGREIVKDSGAGSDCVVSWTPKWTGKFRVRVVNNGSVASNYILIAN